MKIFYTSDVHGYFLPTDYMDKEKKPLGLISASENYTKDENTLIIDAGDILQGSVFDYYLHENGQSEKVADLVNKASYSHITIGNHDFNYGYDYLKNYLNKLDAKCICANVKDLKGEITNLQSYDIVTIEGKTVGIIGAVTDWVNIWEQKKNLEYFKVEDTLTSLKTAYEKIKDCDYKICIYHGGVDFDTKSLEINEVSGENIASKIAGDFDLDLLLTGHQHLEIEHCVYKNTNIVQPSSFGNKYGEIIVDLSSKEIQIKLKDIDGDFDQELFSQEIELNKKINSFIDEKIYQLDKDYPAGDKLEMALKGSQLADLINKIQLEITGADISIMSFANEVSGFSKDLTIREIINTLRFPNTLVVFEINGKTLRRGLNKNYEYILKDEKGFRINASYIEPKLSHYNFDFYYGIDFEIDYDKPLNQRIGKIYYNGKELGDEDTLTIVMNNYRATGVSGFDMYKGLKMVKEINIEMTQLVIDYFLNKNK